MTARGFVEGRRPGTPPAKITDHEIKAEDVRHMSARAKLAGCIWPIWSAHMAPGKKSHDRACPRCNRWRDFQIGRDSNNFEDLHETKRNR